MVSLREEINKKWERIHELMDAQIKSQKEILKNLEETAKLVEEKYGSK